MTRLDPRSPLVLDTKDIARRPGTMVTLARSVEAPAEFGTDVISIPQGDPVALDLRLESVVEGVLVSGSVRGEAVGACVRCLDPVHHSVDGFVQELFAYADRAAHHQQVGAGEGETEEHLIEDGLIDLEPVLRDVVVPALPFQPLCSPDCPGLCSECGARLADDPGHAHEVLDPRWSALAALSSVGEERSTTGDAGTTSTTEGRTAPGNDEKRN